MSVSGTGMASLAAAAAAAVVVASAAVVVNVSLGW